VPCGRPCGYYLLLITYYELRAGEVRSKGGASSALPLRGPIPSALQVFGQKGTARPWLSWLLLAASSGYFHFLNVPHINNRPSKPILSYAKLKLNRRVGRQRQPILFFYLASARLAPIVALASTSFANPAFLPLAVVLVSALRGVQSPGGEETEISLL
jgi:hypothetical protein